MLLSKPDLPPGVEKAYREVMRLYAQWLCQMNPDYLQDCETVDDFFRVIYNESDVRSIAMPGAATEDTLLIITASCDDEGGPADMWAWVTIDTTLNELAPDIDDAKIWAQQEHTLKIKVTRILQYYELSFCDVYLNDGYPDTSGKHICSDKLAPGFRSIP